jgi:hypothetical protein
MTFDCEFGVNFVSRLLKAVLSSTRYFRNYREKSQIVSPNTLHDFSLLVISPNAKTVRGREKVPAISISLSLTFFSLPFHCCFISQARNDHPTHTLSDGSTLQLLYLSSTSINLLSSLQRPNPYLL